MPRHAVAVVTRPWSPDVGLKSTSFVALATLAHFSLVGTREPRHAYAWDRSLHDVTARTSPLLTTSVTPNRQLDR